jgi:hypothetical protein
MRPHDEEAGMLRLRGREETVGWAGELQAAVSHRRATQGCRPLARESALRLRDEVLVLVR